MSIPSVTSKYNALLLLCLLTPILCLTSSAQVRSRVDFDKGWHFHLGDLKGAEDPGLADSQWRTLNLPHDWSIEGTFSADYPARPDGGALPGGIGWYRKTFTVPASSKNKKVYIDFDGVYQRSTVWVNGHELGFRPNGYISFRYELTQYLRFGGENIIAVKVDNSVQPNSRWYSGSGIYRNVWLETTNQDIAIDHWGTYLTTPKVDDQAATVLVQTSIKQYKSGNEGLKLKTVIYAKDGKVAGAYTSPIIIENGKSNKVFNQQILLNKPELWSVNRPYLYTVVSSIMKDDVVLDKYSTTLGVRFFDFDSDKGFSLNGKPMKILGVCNHHDLGSLGAAINTRALERQIELLKAMGCNAIRTSHNPPAPELLTACDKLGMIVMDEAFDCWEVGKEKYDYHLFFKGWHKRDLEDQVLRDRNHPSVLMWSIGNEIPQQTDTSAIRLAKELSGIVKNLDRSRPITAANDTPDNTNRIITSGAMDLIGYNYLHGDYPGFQKRFPGGKFIATETTSALETRGFYQMPSDSIMRWPTRPEYKTVAKMNADNTVSAYDNVSAPWGSTHEETWKIIKKYDFLSGLFIWTGFDYMGEPTPYSWPSRSSYFGIIDLAGFPKDVYYMYQSEWTNKPVLHIFPHWNWKSGQTVDVWAYYNEADEVELFLNGRSLGVKKKTGDDLHIMWRVKYEAGALKAVSRKNGKIVLASEIHTAGKPAQIELSADRKTINADGKDLSFVTVRILDKDGYLVPNASNRVDFKINGNAFIASVDNGDPVSHAPFKANFRDAYNGLALAIVQSKEKPGPITITATSVGIKGADIKIISKRK